MRYVGLVLLVFCGFTLWGSPGELAYWETVVPLSSPPSVFAPAYAPLDGRILRYGGVGPQGITGELVILEPGTWDWYYVPSFDSQIPPARYGASLTPMPDGRMALFGGAGETGLYNDLWFLNPATWEWYPVVTEDTPPEPRKFHSAWADEEGNFYVYGGIGSDGSTRSDIWQYNPEENAWTRGPDAPADFVDPVDFWCSWMDKDPDFFMVRGLPPSPTGVAQFFGPLPGTLYYSLGPDGEFATADDAWILDDLPENVPPPKYFAGYTMIDEDVYMFGGLYHRDGFTTSTSCLWYYDSVTNGWFYLPSHSLPYAVWDPYCWWDPEEDAVYLGGGWLGWPEALGWEDFLAGEPEDWDWDNWEPNDKVFVLHHPRQLAGPGGPGGQPPGQPPGPGRGPGGQERPRKDQPDEPEEQPPYLEGCLVTDAVEGGEPVSLNPVFTSANATAVFWFKLAPLCDPHSYRVEIYDAEGYLHDSLSSSTPNPDDHGVDCFGSYSSSWEFPLGPAAARPHGTWWAELYLDDVLVCTALFEVRE